MPHIGKNFLPVIHFLLPPLGFGMIITWLWLTFLNGPLIYLVAHPYFNPQFLILFFLIAHSLSFLSMRKIMLSKALQTNISPLCIASATAMAAAPLLLKLWPTFLPYGIVQLATGLTIILAAIGTTVLICFWGLLFSSYTADKVALFYGISIVISTAFLLAGNQLASNHLFFLASVIPLISLLFLWGHLPSSYDVTPEENKIVPNPIPLKLVALIILFYTVGGLMHKLVYLSAPADRELFWMTNIIYSVVTLGAGLYIFIFPNLDLRMLYRPVLPLIFAGFALFPFLMNTDNTLHYILLQAGFALFDLYTWVLFIYLASHHKHPLYVISRGMFFLTFSIFFSDFSVTLILSFVALSASKIQIISFVAASILLLGSFVFQDEAESFAGWTYAANVTAPSHLSTITNDDSEHTATQPPMVSLEKVTPDHIATYLQQCQLTPREQEIVHHLLIGRNNPYIRNELNISDNTLKTHLRNIYRKTEVANRQKLLARIHDMSANQSLDNYADILPKSSPTSS